MFQTSPRGVHSSESSWRVTSTVLRVLFVLVLERVHFLAIFVFVCFLFCFLVLVHEARGSTWCSPQYNYYFNWHNLNRPVAVSFNKRGIIFIQLYDVILRETWKTSQTIIIISDHPLFTIDSSFFRSCRTYVYNKYFPVARYFLVHYCIYIVLCSCTQGKQKANKRKFWLLFLRIFLVRVDWLERRARDSHNFKQTH